MRSRALIALLLLVATAGVYAGVREHEFVNYDDHKYVVRNPNLRAPLSLDSAIHHFASPYDTNWIPLTWISLHVSYALHGLDPAGYLLTNVGLHAASAVVLFLAFARMTGAVGRSAFVAAVFALHPLHVESVAWVSERKDALSGMFWMLTLHAYARYAELPSSLFRYALVMLSLALGLLAKPMLVTLPFVLLLLDHWPLGRLDGRRRVRRALLEKLPLLALAAAVGVVTFVVQRSAGAMSSLPAVPFSQRVINALDSYVVYLAKSVWPSDLAAFYPHPFGDAAAGPAALAALLLAAVTAAVVRLARARPYLAVGWLWYLGTLIPVIGLVQVGLQARADRYMYVPLIGLSLMVAWGAFDLAGRRRGWQRALASAAVAAVAALAVGSWLQVAHWRNTTALYARALEVTRDNYVAHDGLAGVLMEEGNLEEAKAHLAQSLRLRPSWAPAHVGMGDVLAKLGENEAAIRRYERALRLEPRNTRALANLGKVLADSGQLGKAIRSYRRALDLEPETGRAEIHALLAAALGERGDLAGAIDHYRRAISLLPDFAKAHANLGFILIRAERFEQAQRHLERALALEGDSAELHSGLAQTAERLGRPARAVHHYREALRLRPSWQHPAKSLAWLLATHEDPRIRDPRESIRLAEGATRGAATLDTLAAAYAAAGRFDDAIRTATRAAELARDRGRRDLGDAIEARLVLYRSRRPYVEKGTSDEP